MKLQLILSTVLFAQFSVSVSASGGYSGGSSGILQQRQVDQIYEVGKAIYNGRQSGFPKLSYCVNFDDELVSIKSKTIRNYKKGTYENLSQNLYNCDNPDTLIANELSHDGMLHVLYYLNKRYKLSLMGS